MHFLFILYLECGNKTNVASTLFYELHHLCDTIKATIYGQHGQQSIYGSSYLYGLYVTQLRQPFMGNMTLQSIYFINMKC